MSDEHDIQHTGRVIRDEIRIDAPAEEVYHAWADPEAISAWFMSRMEGRLEVGETVEWFWDNTGTGMSQKVLVADAPHRFVTEVALPQGVSYMEVTIEQEGGHSVLRIVQSGFGEGPDWDDQYEGMASGWMLTLGMLKLYLERYRGRPRRELLALGDAPYEQTRLHVLQRSGPGLAEWLTRSGAPGSAEGDEVRLELQNGKTLTGTVLRTTPYEALWSWDEIEGVLELKAFRGAYWGSKVGLRVSSWRQDPSVLTDLEGWLKHVVQRLTEVLNTDTETS